MHYLCHTQFVSNSETYTKLQLVNKQILHFTSLGVFCIILQQRELSCDSHP